MNQKINKIDETLNWLVYRLETFVGGFIKIIVFIFVTCLFDL